MLQLIRLSGEMSVALLGIKRAPRSKDGQRRCNLQKKNNCAQWCYSVFDGRLSIFYHPQKMKVSTNFILDAHDLQASGGTAIKTGMIVSWQSLHGLRNTYRNHCLWTLFNVPATSCKEETTKVTFSWPVRQSGNCSVISQYLKFFLEIRDVAFPALSLKAL